MQAQSLAVFLRELRQEKGLSVRGLAEKANISHTEVFRIEKGERVNTSPALLKALAVALNTPIERFLEAGGYMDIKPVEPVIAARIKGTEDLTAEEITEVQKYIDFLKSKR